MMDMGGEETKGCGSSPMLQTHDCLFLKQYVRQHFSIGTISLIPISGKASSALIEINL